MKPGRNDPCPCGSGKKYKKCCLPKDATSVANLSWQKMRRTEGELVHALLKHADKYYGPSAAAEAWDEFVDASRQGSPYATSGFLQALCAAAGVHHRFAGQGVQEV